MSGELHQISAAIGELRAAQEETRDHRKRVEDKLDEIVELIQRDRHDANNKITTVALRVDKLELKEERRIEDAKAEKGRRAKRMALIVGLAGGAGSVAGPSVAEMLRKGLAKLGLG